MQHRFQFVGLFGTGQNLLETYVWVEYVYKSAEGQTIVPAAGEVCHRNLKQHGGPVSQCNAGLHNIIYQHA